MTGMQQQLTKTYPCPERPKRKRKYSTSNLGRSILVVY
jgi:hypothetical protein